MGLEGFTARDKENDRRMNERSSRKHNEQSFFIDDYNKELRSFVYTYKGQNPAHDFIQYLLGLNGLRIRTGFFK